MSGPAGAGACRADPWPQQADDAPGGGRNAKIELATRSPDSSKAAISEAGAGDVIPRYQGREALLYFDFLLRFWVYWDTTPSAVAWGSAFGFWVGSFWFIIGTFASLSPAVKATARPLSCGTDAYSWWTAFTYLVGNTCWLFACYLQIVESLNEDYEDRVEAWEASGREGRRPRYHWVGVRLLQLDWWGAVCYDVGVALYTTASVALYINSCPSTQMSPELYTVLSTYFYLTAGILFFMAGALYIPVLGSKWVLPNILLPFRKEHWTSMLWWVIWLYFWGGACFFMSGIFLYFYSPLNMKLSTKTYEIQNAIGFGGGSFLFMLGSMLLLMRQSRGRCRPSFGRIGNNCEASVHGGGVYRPMRSRAGEHM